MDIHDNTTTTAKCANCGERIYWVGGLINEWLHTKEDHFATPEDGTLEEVSNEG